MDHRRIDERSQAMGCAIAERLSAHPELIPQAKATVERWLATASPGVSKALHERLIALDGPIEGVIELLTSPDERATRLRQSNPFAGLLPQHERNAILLQFQSHDAASP
jgi:hypothetical protein